MTASKERTNVVPVRLHAAEMIKNDLITSSEKVLIFLVVAKARVKISSVSIIACAVIIFVPISKLVNLTTIHHRKMNAFPVPKNAVCANMRVPTMILIHS